MQWCIKSERTRFKHQRLQTAPYKNTFEKLPGNIHSEKKPAIFVLPENMLGVEKDLEGASYQQTEYFTGCVPPAE